MDAFYEKLVRPVLFRLFADAEAAHEYARAALTLLAGQPWLVRLLEGAHLLRTQRPVELFGLTFPNHVGLAAGFDKDAEFWAAAGAFGFGHVEVGTVTRLGQPGNARPRLFRFPEEEAVLNRMGFNNAGAEAMAARLRRQTRARHRIVLGVNLGKNKATELERAAEDYLAAFHAVADYADYVTVNVSSPNTPGLRQLQDAAHLRPLLRGLRAASRERAKKMGRKPLPLLLKLAPDLSYPQLDDALAVALEAEFDGLIAGNTTLARPGALAAVKESGGLSGRPLLPRALDVVRYLVRAAGGRLPVVGCGGITTAEAAGRFLDEGAALVQLYTGWIYRGPFFPRDIARALAPRAADWV